MLGSAVFRAFYDRHEYDLTATVRSPSTLRFFSNDEQNVIRTNVDMLDPDSLLSLFETVKPHVVINCVGLIKQFEATNNPLVALPINSIFPHRLARIASLCGARLVHISTDCVFSGSKGMYIESDRADATDLYGISKYLGEAVSYPHAITLRTSIIGRELDSSHSLVDWFLAQQGEIKGYDKAIFTGLPTSELATVIRDTVLPRADLSGLYHVSTKPISKHDLLTLIAAEYGKKITIRPDSEVTIDRSLDSTRFQAATGYVAPEWPELVRRMHATDTRRDR